jgi:hypothetical protein
VVRTNVAKKGIVSVARRGPRNVKHIVQPVGNPSTTDKPAKALLALKRLVRATPTDAGRSPNRA